MKQVGHTRRQIIVGGVATAWLAARGRRTFAADAPVPASSPASPPPAVIDTHTHFYDPSRPHGVPWPPKGDRLLYRPVLPAEYKRLAAPLGVTGTVVVEASGWVEDNQFVLDLAKDTPFIVGLCGNLTPGTPDFRQHLARFAKDPLFRGIRISGDGWRPRAADPAFLDDLRRLADADLQLDVNVGVEGLADTARLADAVPALRVVLDHCANTPIDGGPVRPNWLAGIKELAGRKTVWAKVSGLVEGTGKRNADAPADGAFYRPILDALWALFGEDRLVWGSNWPVSARFAPLDRVHAIVRDYFAAKGETAVRKVFAENARAAYKWAAR